jgi:hypothetical protein
MSRYDLLNFTASARGNNTPSQERWSARVSPRLHGYVQADAANLWVGSSSRMTPKGYCVVPGIREAGVRVQV